MTKQMETREAMKREVFAALGRLMSGIEETKALQPVRVRRAGVKEQRQ